MTPEEARKYLLAVRATLSESSVPDKSAYIAAMDAAMEALSPPKGAGRCAWAENLPGADWTPYEDVLRTAAFSRKLDERMRENAELTLTKDERRLVFVAILCYRSILSSLYREQILKDTERAILQGLADYRMGGEETSCCQD